MPCERFGAHVLTSGGGYYIRDTEELADNSLGDTERNELTDGAVQGGRTREKDRRDLVQTAGGTKSGRQPDIGQSSAR